MQRISNTVNFYPIKAIGVPLGFKRIAALNKGFKATATTAKLMNLQIYEFNTRKMNIST